MSKLLRIESLISFLFSFFFLMLHCHVNEDNISRCARSEWMRFKSLFQEKKETFTIQFLAVKFLRSKNKKKEAEIKVFNVFFHLFTKISGLFTMIPNTKNSIEIEIVNLCPSKCKHKNLNELQIV